MSFLFYSLHMVLVMGNRCRPYSNEHIAGNVQALHGLLLLPGSCVPHVLPFCVLSSFISLPRPLDYDPEMLANGRLDLLLLALPEFGLI